MENPFVKLFAIDFKDHLEVKKSGNTELKYVSWAYAWAEVKKLYPSASYEVKKFNGLPYVYDPITGFMVYTTVTIEGVSHEMWLPVLDGANKAMKAVPYTYTTRHTYASLCDCAGVNKDILKRAVGHTPKSKTLDEVYLHPKATQMIEAFDKANQLVNDEVLTTTKA